MMPLACKCVRRIVANNSTFLRRKRAKGKKEIINCKTPVIIPPHVTDNNSLRYIISDVEPKANRQIFTTYKYIHDNSLIYTYEKVP